MRQAEMTSRRARRNQALLCLAGILTGATGSAAAATPQPECARLPRSAVAPAVRLDAAQQAARVPASALTTFPGHEVRELRTEKPSGTATILVLLQNGAPTPLVSLRREAKSADRAIALYRSPTADLQDEARLAAAEHLYAFLMRQDPQERFRIAGGKAGSAQQRTLSHAAALTLARDIRRCAAQELAGKRPSVKIVPWLAATIAPLPSQGAHGLKVQARVRDPQGQPLTGQLTFGRGGHLACAATVSPAGQGACTLFDSHGHDLHDDEHAAPTTVTYSGIVTPGRIVLPTTAVYGGASKRRGAPGRAHP